MAMGQIEQVYETVRLGSGVKNADIHDMTGLDPVVIFSILKSLRDTYHLVKSVGERTATKWYPVNKDAPLLEHLRGMDRPARGGSAKSGTALSPGQRAKVRYQRALEELAQAGLELQNYVVDESTKEELEELRAFKREQLELVSKHSIKKRRTA